jgi:hypothetical protein
MIGRGLRLHEASLKKDAVIIELMDEKIVSSVATRGGRKTDFASLLATGYGLSQQEVENGNAFLHEKARRSRVEKGWRERSKLYEGLRSVESVMTTFDIIERVSRVSRYAWIPLGMNSYYMGLADGDFIEVVAEANTYFEIRAVVDSELKFIGAGPSWSDAIALADSWLARNGVDGGFTRRDRGWREKHAKEAQVNLAHKLTGLPKEFLSSLKRGQVSDLITSARALLLPVESVEVGGREPVVSEWHRWQFQPNS